MRSAQLGQGLVVPLALAAVMLVGAFVAWAIGWRRTRAALFTLAALTACLCSIATVGDRLLAPLEGKYPPLPSGLALPHVQYIVVLGTGYEPRDAIPITAALDGDGLARIAEGVRLMKQMGLTRLVVSGGAPPGYAAPARGYAQLAREFGVPSVAITVLDTGVNTAQEARAITAHLGSAPFLLVTSAYHMPRAMLLMKRAGANPIPAPTGQLTGRPLRWRDWLPSSEGLARSERALHEYLGLAAVSAHASD